MSLFGFADIKFNKVTGAGSGNRDDGNGPLRALEGTAFDQRSLRYPVDIGNYDKGHYMVFYIREQKASRFAKNDNVSDDVISGSRVDGATQFQNIPLVGNAATNFGSGLLSKLNSGLGELNSATGGALSGITGAVSKAAGGVVGTVNSLFGQAASITVGDAKATQSVLSTNIAAITNDSFIKTTQLTKDAIALYMPDTLQFQYSQSYSDLQLGGELIGQIVAAGRTAMGTYESEGAFKAAGGIAQAAVTGAIKKGTQAAGEALGGPNSGQVGAYLASKIVTNPLLEIIYQSPNFRNFQFDFMFYPRDEREALEVQQIVERFRFHQAPEYARETMGFLIPPSEFDIRFYYGGAENPNIPKIGTCVLKDIQINYAPNGWSAYEVPGESLPSLGRTGMPVAMQLTLSFQETSILTKRNYRDASSGQGIASMRDGDARPGEAGA